MLGSIMYDRAVETPSYKQAKNKANKAWDKIMGGRYLKAEMKEPGWMSRRVKRATAEWDKIMNSSLDVGRG